MASSSASPPTPNTNRRVLYDLSIAANIALDDQRLKSFRIALIAAETWKRKDLMAGGAFIGPEGIQVFARGKKPLELDEIDPKVLKKEMKKWVEKNFDEEKKKAVEEAGILKTTRAKGKVAAVGKVNESAARSGSKSNATAEPSIQKLGKKSSGDDIDNDGYQQVQKEEEYSIEIDWDADITYTWNCDQIRRKIRTFLENSGMEVTTFQRAINAPSGTYGRFMKLRGAQSGGNYRVFEGATRFFHAREAAGLGSSTHIEDSESVPEKPKPFSAEPAPVTASHEDDIGSGSAAQNEDLDITLDDLSIDTIPVFDSCDEIRRKITNHLRLPHVTQAQFLRDIAAQFTTQDVKIQGKQLSDFRSKRGALAGNTSRVFYGAYVYFEMLRLKEGKPKSKHRLEMEKRWEPDGVDIETGSSRVKYIVRAGREPVMDEFGMMSIY